MWWQFVLVFWIAFSLGFLAACLLIGGRGCSEEVTPPQRASPAGEATTGRTRPEPRADI